MWIQMAAYAISVWVSSLYTKENIYFYNIFYHSNFCSILASDGIYSVAAFEARPLWVLEG